jgi:hypothetical protein
MAGLALTLAGCTTSPTPTEQDPPPGTAPAARAGRWPDSGNEPAGSAAPTPGTPAASGASEGDPAPGAAPDPGTAVTPVPTNPGTPPAGTPTPAPLTPPTPAQPVGTPLDDPKAAGTRSLGEGKVVKAGWNQKDLLTAANWDGAMAGCPDPDAMVVPGTVAYEDGTWTLTGSGEGFMHGWDQGNLVYFDSSNG